MAVCRAGGVWGAWGAWRAWGGLLLLVGVVVDTGVDATMVDLTHVLNNRSMHHQLFRNFELQSFMHGRQDEVDGLWIAANDLLLSEHTGTHIDAPAHAWETGIHMEEVRMEDLIGPAIVISVPDGGAADPDHLLTRRHVLDFEEKHGRIPPRAIVLMETGGAKDYWKPAAYLGTDTVQAAGTMHYPGFGGPVVEWLIRERQINGIGTDRMSFDAGQNAGFPAHIALLSKNKFGLENLNNLLKLPPVGATLVVGALPIEGGSASPARVLAFWNTELPLLGSTSALYPQRGVLTGAAVLAFICVVKMCL